MENNLSETAFFISTDDQFFIRWFTPKVEMDLAGHPILAAAHTIFTEMFPDRESVSFLSKIDDKLNVVRKNNLLNMDFPSHPPKECDNDFEKISHALGRSPSKFLFCRYGIAIFNNEREIRSLSPDFNKLNNLKYNGICVTAQGDNVDFVSRFFAPKLGIQEDPVTGSAHCELVPYWSHRLNKKQMTAQQLSSRRKKLYCSDMGKRVVIGEEAITYMRGEVQLSLF